MISTQLINRQLLLVSAFENILEKEIALMVKYEPNCNNVPDPNLKLPEPKLYMTFVLVVKGQWFLRECGSRRVSHSLSILLYRQDLKETEKFLKNVWREAKKISLYSFDFSVCLFCFVFLFSCPEMWLINQPFLSGYKYICSVSLQSSISCLSTEEKPFYFKYWTKPS